MKFAASNTLLVVFVLAVMRQTAVAQSPCAALLQHGVFNVNKLNSESEKFGWMLNKLCSEKHTTEQAFNNSAANAGIPIEGLLIGLGGSSESGSFIERYSKLCSWNEAKQEDRAKISSWIQTASVKLAQEFNKCIAAKGFHVWLEPTADPRRFRVVAIFNSSGDPSKFVASFSLDDAVRCGTLRKADLERGVEITGSGLNVVCHKKNPLGPVVVSVHSRSVQATTGSLELPAGQIPDVLLLASSVDKSVGVLGPPENPLATYEALTDAYEYRTIDGVSKLVDKPVPEGYRSAEWRIEQPVYPGQYKVLASYTSDGSRPLDLYIDGKIAIKGAFTTDTLKGRQYWLPAYKIVEEAIGSVRLKDGVNVLRIVTSNPRQSFPHVHSLVLRFESQ